MTKGRDGFKAAIKRALEEIFSDGIDDDVEEQAYEIFNRIVPRTSFFRGIIVPINNLNKTAADIGKAIKQLRNVISLSEAAKTPSITRITQQSLPTWFKALIPGFQAAQQLSLNEIIEKLSPKEVAKGTPQEPAKGTPQEPAKGTPQEPAKGTPQEPAKEASKQVFSWPTASELARRAKRHTKIPFKLSQITIPEQSYESLQQEAKEALREIESKCRQLLTDAVLKGSLKVSDIVPKDLFFEEIVSLENYTDKLSSEEREKLGNERIIGIHEIPGKTSGKGPSGGKPGFIAPSASDFLGTDSILLSLVAAVLSSMGMAYVVPIVAIIKKILPKITGNLFGTKPESQTKKENTENLFDKISKVLSKTGDEDSGGGLFNFAGGFFKNTKFLKLVAGISILTVILTSVIQIVQSIFNFVKKQREDVSRKLDEQRKLADLVPVLAGAYAVRDVYKLRDQMQIGYGMQGALKTEIGSERYFFENTRQIHIAVENLKSFQRTTFNYAIGALLAPLNNIAGLLNRLLGFLGAEQDKEGLIVPPSFRNAMEDFISGAWYRQNQNNDRDPGPLGQ